jgi:hypothetical protein
LAKLKVPTIFASFRDGKPPLSNHLSIFLTSSISYGSDAQIQREGHVRVFPEEFRNIAWEKNWFEKNKITYSTEKFESPLAHDSIPVPD